MKTSILSILMAALSLGNLSEAQTMPKDELIFLTSSWKGERFEDGRPRIPDDILRRAGKINIDDAWTVLKNDNYLNQFEYGWKMVNPDIRIVGRALTAMFMPSRPDLEQVIKDRGHQQGHKGETNSWPIEVLKKGDVYVADGFGKIAGGTLVGSTLGNSIFNKSGNGVVFDGSARDVSGLAEIKGFNAFVRDFHPSFLENVMLMGLNTPIRIGQAIVLPGDLVIADREGVLFIPAHLAEEVVSTAEFVVLKDQFNEEMLRTGKFESGQLDNQWGDPIKSEFLIWLGKHPELGKMSREELDKVLLKRTW